MTSESPTLYCVNHPDTPTGLRCNNCERPICPKCAVLTDTGYRCRDCVRGFQKRFNTAEWYDYPVGMLVAGGMAFLGSLVVFFFSTSWLGWLTLLLAPSAGVLIAETTRKAIRKKRSRQLFQMIALAALLGCLPVLLFTLFGGLQIFRLIWLGVYTVAVTSSVYYRLSGISMR